MMPSRCSVAVCFSSAAASVSCREFSAALTCWNRTPDESLQPPPQSPQPFSGALLRAPSRPPQRISPSLRPRPPPAPRHTAAPAEAAAALTLRCRLRRRLRRPRARLQPQKGAAPRHGARPRWLRGPAMARRRRFSPLGGRPPAGRGWGWGWGCAGFPAPGRRCERRSPSAAAALLGAGGRLSSPRSAAGAPRAEGSQLPPCGGGPAGSVAGR